MSGSSVSLVVSVFLSCAVEAVEAFTIVLAVSISRRASSALFGAAAALVVLAAIVAALGSALTALPIELIRLVVGLLLLGLGLQWLRKAVLRAAGAKAKHDEEAIFAVAAEQAVDAAPATPDARLDVYAFSISFKAVLLEGLEVVLIVIGFGGARGELLPAAAVALGAVLVVAVVGLAARAPLARVPENAMKFGVGVLLTAFGIFWTVEGCGVDWPGGEVAALGLVALVLLAALAATRVVAGSPQRRAAEIASSNNPKTTSGQPS